MSGTTLSAGDTAAHQTRSNTKLYRASPVVDETDVSQIDMV